MKGACPPRPRAYDELVEQEKRRVVRLAPGQLRVTPVRKDPPDLERFVAALLAFTLDRRAKVHAARAKQEASDGGDP